MKYSPSASCFYPEDIAYPALPADLIETGDDVFLSWCEAEPGSTITVGGDGTLTIAPPPALTLGQIQMIQIGVLNAAYKTAASAPVSFTTQAGATASFPQTPAAKTYLAQCIETGSSAWALNLWLDVSNVPVTPFTFADLQGLAAAMEAVEVPAYQDLLAKIGEVNAATTAEAVQAVAF